MDLQPDLVIMLDLTDWLMITGGIAAILWVNWYFFVAQRASFTASKLAGGVQRVIVAVKGGYSPATIHVSAGAPVQLVFDRQETSGCSEEVVFPDFGIRRFLPAHQQTTVELTPPAPGTYEFTCGMSMLRGKLVAE